MYCESYSKTFSKYVTCMQTSTDGLIILCCVLLYWIVNLLSENTTKFCPLTYILKLEGVLFFYSSCSSVFLLIFTFAKVVQHLMHVMSLYTVHRPIGPFSFRKFLLHTWQAYPAKQAMLTPSVYTASLP